MIDQKVFFIKYPTIVENRSPTFKVLGTNSLVLTVKKDINAGKICVKPSFIRLTIVNLPYL